jgi:hypothetical protein
MKPSEAFEGENSSLRKAFDNATDEKKYTQWDMDNEYARGCNDGARMQLEVMKEQTCTNCDCRWMPIEGNLCECGCHAGDNSTQTSEHDV